MNNETLTNMLQALEGHKQELGRLEIGLSMPIPSSIYQSYLELIKRYTQDIEKLTVKIHLERCFIQPAATNNGG